MTHSDDPITETTFEGQSTAVSATLGTMERLAYLKQLTMDNPKVTHICIYQGSISPTCFGKQKKLQRRSGLFGLNGLHADYKTGPKSSFIIDLTSSVNFVTTSSTIDRGVLLKKKTTAIL